MQENLDDILGVIIRGKPEKNEEIPKKNWRNPARSTR